MRDAVRAEVAGGRGRSVAHITHALKGGGRLPVNDIGEPVVVSDAEIDTDIRELVAQGVIYASGDGYKLVSEIA